MNIEYEIYINMHSSASCEEEIHHYVSKAIKSSRISVKKSWLGDFNGLFALNPILQDNVVCIYTGQV